MPRCKTTRDYFKVNISKADECLELVSCDT